MHSRAILMFRKAEARAPREKTKKEGAESEIFREDGEQMDDY